MARYINITETAKIIRSELQAAFPGISFSVRCSQYSMGCHIIVRWTNGPTARAVEKITDSRYGTGFDGMTDSTTSHNQTFNGEVVHFSGSRPHCSREISPAYEATYEQAWNALSDHERFVLTCRHDFPRWPEDRPGYRLAQWEPTT